METIRDKTLFPDLPSGPLDKYRQNSKFDYRKLALLLDGEKCLRFRVRSYKSFFSIRAEMISVFELFSFYK